MPAPIEAAYTVRRDAPQTISHAKHGRTRIKRIKRVQNQIDEL